MDPGEDETATARREIYEEVGLRTVRFVPGFRTESTYQPRPDVNKLVVFFLAEAPDEPIRLLAGEQTDYQWLPLQAATARLTYHEDRRVVVNAVTFLANTRL